MAFSKRIKKLASLVDSNAYVIDVGCDHALLDIYLTLYNNNKCLAVDINENALKSAYENIKKYKLNIEVKQSNGLDNIDVPNNSVCVIAGMGTNLILDILSNEKTEKINTLIIQTNKDYKALRDTMIKKGYFIVDELAFLDKKIWYVIIKFKKGHVKYKRIETILGPVLLKKYDNETVNYFKSEYDKYCKVLSNIPKKYVFKRFKIKYIINKIKIYIKNVGPSL
ncbi:MAG: SAM-dependent methyltransferase [Bacilli bacterium]|nr:SAM-dependent methyltransferase [Bacilli bacterium]